MLVLLLLLVALVSALTAMRLAIHGREIAVPKFVGLTPAEAERAAATAGLQIAIERQYYSSQVPEGKIMSQIPEAGTHVRHGWQVRVAESLGPQRVIVPDLLGQSERAADLNIRRRGLDVGAVAQVSLPGTPDSQVISQSPPPDASGISAPKISLLITTAPEPLAFVMPNFVGQRLADATAQLEGAGMRLGIVSIASQATPANDAIGGSLAISPASESTILLQNPAAGQKILTGTVVNFQVKP